MHSHDHHRFAINELALLHDQLNAAFDLVEEPRHSIQSRRIRIVAAVAAAAAVVAAAVLLMTGSLAKTPLSTEDAIAEIVAATLAAGDPDPDQYQYSKFITHSFAPFPDRYLSEIEPPFVPAGSPGQPRFDAFIDRQTESWLSLDRPGFVHRRAGHPTYPTDTDQERAEEFLAKERAKMKKRGDDFHYDEGAGVGSFVIPDTGFQPLYSNTYGFAPQKGYWFNGRTHSPEEVSEFPTDPNKLISQLKVQLANYPSGVDDGLWAVLADHFTPGFGVPLPAKQQAAVVEAIGLVDGVESLGERKDSLGRTCLAFARTFGTTRQEICFDRDSGKLAESKLIIASNDPPKLPKGMRLPDAYQRLSIGTVVDGFTLVDQQVVDELPDWVITNLKQNTQEGKQDDLKLYLR